MQVLIVLNDAPYGTERAYNALRLVLQLGADHPETRVTLFLMADAVGCALTGQRTPNGYYNIERMLTLALRRGTEVLLCGSCLDARGLGADRLVPGTRRSDMATLARHVLAADRNLVF